MVDLAKIAKAKIELEELYSGIPDDSVNLTFRDLADVRQQNPSVDKKSSHPLDLITEATPRKEEVSPSTKLPSLDFSRGLEASAPTHHQIHYQSHHLPYMHHLSHIRDTYNAPMNNNHLHNGFNDHHQAGVDNMHGNGGQHYVHGESTPHHHASTYTHRMHNHMIYDDLSQMSGMTMASMSEYPERGGRRRPGIPHSNICTFCSTYIYIFRHRCLVNLIDLYSLTFLF